LPIKDTVILAGAKDLSRIYNGVVQHRDVEQMVVHPKYKGGVAPFDLGLIRVTTPFDVGYVVRPIKLPDANKIFSGMTRVYGWGEDLDPNQFNDILQVCDNKDTANTVDLYCFECFFYVSGR
jgi:Trypsin